MFHYDIDFKDKNGERYMLPIRAGALLKRLWKRAILSRVPLEGVERRDGKHSAADLDGGDWTPYRPQEDSWGGQDCYVWFRHRFTVPAQLSGKTLWYWVEAGDADHWQWANPQMCLYLNGTCIAGMDSNHRYVEFTTDAEGNAEYQVHISGYTDTVYYEGPVRFRPFLAAVEPAALSLYYDLRFALEAAAQLDTDDAARVRLVRCANEAFRILALEAAEEPFLASVRQAAEYLSRELFSQGETRGQIAAVGSTHIDVAWLWRYEQTREKACRSFATAARLLEKNPEFIFMSSQPQLYQFVKEDDPTLYAQIKEWVARGRWEAEGAAWVEPDTNLPGGESLIRQLLYGKKFFREEFGTDSRVLWLPDVFGYSGALPQIMKKCGVDYFMTTKISWNEFNKVPYDTFRWRGIDGSEVLAHFIPSMDNAKEEKDWLTTYNGVLAPSMAVGAWKRYQQKDLNGEVLGAFGYGDGGGGTNQEMVECGKRLEKGLPGCPRLRFSKVRDFYQRLEAELEGQRHIPVWEGELYFEYHRGTYTSVGSIKRANRKNELLLRDAELLSVMAAGLDGGSLADYPAEALEECWKLLLLNQFHDVLPGSSIAPVYQDALEHHRKIRERAGALLEEALDRLAAELPSEGPAAAFCNTLSFPRRELAAFSWNSDAPVLWLQGGEGEHPAVRQADGSYLTLTEEVPPLGWRTCSVREGGPAAPAGRWDPERRVLENRWYRLSFDRRMEIESLLEKESSRETLPRGETGGRLLAYEDVSRCDDAWNIPVYYEEKCWEAEEPDRIELVEDSPLRTVVRVRRRFRDSTFWLSYIVYEELERIDLEIEADWRETDILMKLDFPVAANTVKATFDIQFGSVERPIHRNTLWDFARFEVCAHKWVDLSDNGGGLTLLSESKYGYDVRRGHIRATLLKSSTYPDPAQDRGRHVFSYALLPHSGPLSLEAANRAGYSFNVPLYARRLSGAGRNGPPLGESFLTLEGEGFLLEAVKRSEDGQSVTLRIFDGGNRGGTCRLRTERKPEAVWEANMLEERRRRLRVEEDGSVPLDFAPFEIKTVLVRFRGGDDAT